MVYFNLNKNGATYWEVVSAIIENKTTLNLTLNGFIDENATEPITLITTQMSVANPENKLVFIDPDLTPIVPDIIVALFDVAQAKGELMASFQTEMLKYAPYWSILSDLIGFKNFAGVKQYLGALQQAGISNQDDVNKFTQIFTNQGITL